MLKISTTEEQHRIVLKIEGKLISPWTEELERFWKTLAARLHKKTLCLDLRDATHADRNGLALLGRILRSANPTVLADTPLTRQFVEQALQVEPED